MFASQSKSPFLLVSSLPSDLYSFIACYLPLEEYMSFRSTCVTVYHSLPVVPELTFSAIIASEKEIGRRKSREEKSDECGRQTKTIFLGKRVCS